MAYEPCDPCQREMDDLCAAHLLAIGHDLDCSARRLWRLFSTQVLLGGDLVELADIALSAQSQLEWACDALAARALAQPAQALPQPATFHG